MKFNLPRPIRSRGLTNTCLDNVSLLASHLQADVRFSNRPFGVKRFQTIRRSLLLMSLAGSCFSSESAPRPFHHRIRRRGGTISTAALPTNNGGSKRTYELTSSIVPRG